MVLLTRIYTRGGDKGMTSLGDGTRVAKHALRVEACGAVDEANALLGIVRLHVKTDSLHKDLEPVLMSMQNDMFDVGADICVPVKEEEKNTPEEGREKEGRRKGPLRIIADQVKSLEETIDRFNENLDPLTSFILPGGTALASYLHVSRTSLRRAERRVTALDEVEPVNPEVMAYLNRASDLMFVLGRVANQMGSGDILWVPGANR